MTTPSAPPVVAAIQALVCDYYRVSREDLLGPVRERRFAHPRRMAMALAHDVLDRSTTQLGRYFDRDHSTVVKTVGYFRKIRDGDSDVAADFAHLRVQAAAIAARDEARRIRQTEALDAFDRLAGELRQWVAAEPERFLRGGLGAAPALRRPTS
jgi:Bacterial dnaA protein helix-turn-helix